VWSCAASLGRRTWESTFGRRSTGTVTRGLWAVLSTTRVDRRSCGLKQGVRERSRRYQRDYPGGRVSNGRRGSEVPLLAVHGFRFSGASSPPLPLGVGSLLSSRRLLGGDASEPETLPMTVGASVLVKQTRIRGPGIISRSRVAFKPLLRRAVGRVTTPRHREKRSVLRRGRRTGRTTQGGRKKVRVRRGPFSKQIRPRSGRGGRPRRVAHDSHAGDRSRPESPVRPRRRERTNRTRDS
jgi:hypothetical protein